MDRLVALLMRLYFISMLSENELDHGQRLRDGVVCEGLKVVSFGDGPRSLTLACTREVVSWHAQRWLCLGRLARSCKLGAMALMQLSGVLACAKSVRQVCNLFLRCFGRLV